MGDQIVHTYCRICVANCGLEITVDPEANQIKSIEPDRQNVYTWRDFCRKGKTADQVLAHPRRILTPMRRVGDHYEPATYAEAIADIAGRLNGIIDRYGADAVGTYSGNPMGFSFSTTTFWNGLQDALGTQNRFWVGSVDTNNLHVVADMMYGSEVFSLVPDISDCDFYLLVGMDPAVSKFNWFYNCPDGWSRVLKRKRETGAQIVVVDPRRSATAEKATTHVAILPGQDWAFLLGMVKIILDEKLEKLSTTVPLNGVLSLRTLVAEVDLSDLSSRCGVNVATIRDVARRFAGARTAFCDSHTGVAHNEFGTVGEWLSQVLNIITDRLDRPGGKRYERGFLNIDKILGNVFPPSTHRTRLRDLPAIAGYHSSAEIASEIQTPGPGQIKAMLVAFGNPVISAANGNELDQGLSELDLLVSIDLVQRESHRHADWLIPGTHWLERDDMHPLLANLQEAPFVQFGHRAVSKPEGVLEEWEFFTELALAMNRDMFGKRGANRAIGTSRWLARALRKPNLALNPEWFQRAMVALGRGVSWKGIVSRPHGWRYAEPRFGDMANALRTPDKHVQVAPPRIVASCRQAIASPPVTTPDFPLVLINKRSRTSMNSWLNETPGLWSHDRTNVAELHPQDAENCGVTSGDVIRVSSVTGSVELHAEVSDAMRPGIVCIPHGWGSTIYDPTVGGRPVTYGTNRNLLVDSNDLDALSQIPKLNSTAVAVQRVRQGGADLGAMSREFRTVPSGPSRPTD